MAKIGKVQEVAIAELKPYANNAKIHGEDQLEKLRASIREFGFISPCLIDSEKNIIAGHGRVMAAEQLGMKKVPCVYVEGLTEEQRRAYILADNRLTELGGWDKELVSVELEELKDSGYDITLTGFDIDDIIFDDIEDIDIEPEEYEKEIQTRAKRGDVWALGNHRLMCGDSTDPNDVEKLMGGEAADLLETDPPYNVDYQKAPKRPARGIENDNMPDDDFYQFLLSAFRNACEHMNAGAGFYIWHASANSMLFLEALGDSGLALKQILIWVKSVPSLTRQDYQWRHEPCLYGWKEGAPHYFIDVRTLNTVQEYDLQRLEKDELVKIVSELLDNVSTITHEAKPRTSELHPTMKPISLIKKHIRNSSKEGEVVLDLFGGSGTTLLACEEMNRRCFMMEFDPHYADVILDRWEEQTGKKAVRIDERANEA